jgi:Zn-dependent protease with chaperone function
VVGLNPTFFVTEAQVHCLAPWEWLRGRTLYVSLPLCRILTHTELQAVISHELGHFQGSDTRFSQRFYPLYRGTEAALTALASTGSVLDTVVDLVKGWVVFFALWGLVWWLGGNTVTWRFAVFFPLQGLAISPAWSLLWFFYQIFTRAERTVSRERELAADQRAVHVTGTRSLATALVKLSLFADVWDQLRHTLPPPRNLSALFATTVQATTRQRILDRFAVLGTEERERAWTHPTDSHPPLAQRLQALGVSEAEAAALVLDLAPAEPAIQLIPDYHRLEEVLTALVQGRITTEDLFAYMGSYSDIELRD